MVKKLSIISIIHFLVYSVIALFIGGDAVNGYAKDGHYFLRLGAYFNEVDYPLFLYSIIHTYVLIANYALLFLLAIFSVLVKGNRNKQISFPRLAGKPKVIHRKKRRQQSDLL